mgnify:CR=1 FL=1
MLKFIIIFFFVGNFIYSQVGIGTTDPKSSLDIYQQTGNNPQGVLIPRLSGDALKVMSLSLDQHSMLVYSLSAANSRMGTVAELIDSEGYYYYDSSINRFVKICSNSSSSPVMLKGVYVPGSYANQTKHDFDLQLGTVNSDKTYFILSETVTSNPQAVIITGIQGGVDGRIITIVSHQQNFGIQLQDSNTNSAVGNRINTLKFTGSTSLQINNKGYVTLMYQISDGNGM